MRKQIHQTALENCYGLKLAKCWLQFKKINLLCHLLWFSAHCRSLLYRHGSTDRTWLLTRRLHSTCLTPNCVINKLSFLGNNDTSFWNFVPNSGLRKSRHCTSIAIANLSVVHNDCDVTATWNKHVHFSARLHEVAANHNAGIGVGAVDQLWRHC